MLCVMCCCYCFRRCAAADVCVTVAAAATAALSALSCCTRCVCLRGVLVCPRRVDVAAVVCRRRADVLIITRATRWRILWGETCDQNRTHCPAVRHNGIPRGVYLCFGGPAETTFCIVVFTHDYAIMRLHDDDSHAHTKIRAFKLGTQTRSHTHAHERDDGTIINARMCANVCVNSTSVDAAPRRFK